MQIIVAGGGIFTWSFLWNLSFEVCGNLEIILIDGSNYFPPCSLSSTALVARRANLWGGSPLGDLIQHSWHWWEYQIRQKNLNQKNGIHHCPLYYSLENNNKKIHYIKTLPQTEFSIGKIKKNVAVEPSYLIEANQWLHFLKQDVIKNFNNSSVKFTVIQNQVVEFNSEKAEITLLNKEKLQADFLVFQPGAYFIDKSWPTNTGKNLFGSYLEFDCQFDPCHEPFAYSCANYNLYYQNKSHKLQIGVFSQEEDQLEKAWTELSKMREQAIEDGWNIPKLELAKLKTGRRHKMKQRLPVIGKIDKCFYHLGGYKIGYLVSLFQSKELVQTMLKEMS